MRHGLVTGRAGLPLLAAILLLVGGVSLALILGREDPTDPKAIARPLEGDAPQAAQARDPVTAREVAGETVPEREEAAGSTPDLHLRADSGRPDPDAGRFQGGAGQIRGYIETADTTPFPTVWQLVLEPSTTLTGRERAERRVIEFQAGEQEFVISDLPLAGYDLMPRAAGMNGRRHPVLLERNNDNPYVTLQLHPAGFILGRVVDHEKLATAGLEVTLQALTREGVFETRTDTIGNYRFDDVLDGEYRLVFGPLTSPLLPPQSLRFSAPTMTVPDKQLPPLLRLNLLVLGPDHLPVFEAQVTGAGSDGGLVDVQTDAFGRATALFLPAGRYRLTAKHELYQRVRQSVELNARPTDLTLRLRAR